MGARRHNAGGFAYMTLVTCPQCGARREIEHAAIDHGRLQCNDRKECAARKRDGKFLHRIVTRNTKKRTDMQNDDIKKLAEQVAHKNSPACKNRPEHLANGHGKACKALAREIEAAMREARDAP